MYNVRLKDLIVTQPTRRCVQPQLGHFRHQNTLVRTSVLTAPDLLNEFAFDGWLFVSPKGEVEWYACIS